MQDGAQDGTVGTAALFGFLSETLGELARRIVRLEDHAGDMIANSPRRADLLVVLQDFDLVRQMIEDCARLCTVAAAPGDTRPHQLSQVLRLEALRMRLQGSGRDDKPPVEPAGASGGTGSVDLFP